MLVGRSKVSKTNKFEQVEHFALMRHKNVLQCGIGQLVEVLARAYHVGIKGRIWTLPDVAKRENWYSIRVLQHHSYDAMYTSFDQVCREVGLPSKKKAHLSRVKGNNEMFKNNVDPQKMSLAARNRLDSQQVCYSLGISLETTRILAGCEGEKGRYHVPRTECEVPSTLLRRVWPQLEENWAKLKSNLETGVYQTEISTEDHLSVMEWFAAVFYQDMAEKMDLEEYMKECDGDPFLACKLFNNNEFREYRVRAREYRMRVGQEGAHRAQLQDVVSLIGSAIESLAHQGVQQQQQIMESVEGLHQRVDNVEKSVGFSGTAITQLTSVVHQIHEQGQQALKGQVLITNALSSGLLSQSTTLLGQALAVNQAHNEIVGMLSASDSDSINVGVGSSEHGLIQPSVSPSSNETAQPLQPSQPVSQPETTVPRRGDPKIYTFAIYPRGSEILLCYNKFENGISGKRSVNSIEAEYGTSWRAWKDENGKLVNKTTKTYLSRKLVYEAVKARAASQNISEVAAAAILQTEMEALVGGNSKRGLDFFSDSLKQK